MSSLKPLRFGNVILCEHVSRGMARRYTLVNVIVGDLIIRELPTEMFLSLFIEHIPTDDGTVQMDFEVTVAGKKIGRLSTDSSEKKKNIVGVIASPPFLVQIDKEEKITVDVFSEGRKKQNILSKQIVYRPGPSRPASPKG